MCTHNWKGWIKCAHAVYLIDASELNCVIIVKIRAIVWRFSQFSGKNHFKMKISKISFIIQFNFEYQQPTDNCYKF